MNIVNPGEQGSDAREEGAKPIDLTAYLDILVRYKRSFLLVSGVVVAAGLTFALVATPIYRADMLVQVEEKNSNGSNPSGKSDAGVTPVFDVKPAPSAEIELLRSRMVVGKAVDALHLDIEASPRYFPVLGRSIARASRELSRPGLFGRGGYAWGGESIVVSQLDVPAQMEGRHIELTALGDKRYRVSFASDAASGIGTVGQPLTIATQSGNVSLNVSQLEGRPGAVFDVKRIPRAAAIAAVQDQLIITERGKQSGVISVALEGESPVRTAAILNEIGNEYVEQNVHRKGAEAQKSVSFLEQQLPQLKQQVEAAESRYNAMRNQRGTVDLGEESKLALSQSVQIQTRLEELRQKREELAARFTSGHPSIEIIDRQIASLNAQLGTVQAKIQRLPDVEQNLLRLMRDVKVNTELYQSLLNDVQHLRLVEASKAGTSRLVDPADTPLKPVRPDRKVIVGASLALAILAGLMTVVVRRLLDGGVTDPDEIEQQTGMTVYATIPLSAQQARLPGGGDQAGSVLALQQPDDPAVEALRSFRTALQFAMLNSRNNIVVITGPVPEAGKSFVCANFAAVVAGAGRRVVLIDADLRRGILNRRFQTRRSPGLTEVLMGSARLDDAIQRQIAPGLDFIATGTEPPLAGDLLQKGAMDPLLQQLGNRYDFVLLDTPPVLAASDAGILAAKAGTVFLVARADVTTTSELIAAQRAIRQAGGEVRGVIFNGLNIEGRWYRAHYRFGKYRYLNQYGAAAKTKRA